MPPAGGPKCGGARYGMGVGGGATITCPPLGIPSPPLTTETDHNCRYLSMPSVFRRPVPIRVTDRWPTFGNRRCASPEPRVPAQTPSSAWRWPAERGGPSAVASGRGRHFPVLCPSIFFPRPTRRPLLACSVATALDHVTLLPTGSTVGGCRPVPGPPPTGQRKRHPLSVSYRKAEICYEEACHIHASRAPYDAVTGPSGLSDPKDGAPKTAAASQRRSVWSRAPRIGTSAILRRFWL